MSKLLVFLGVVVAMIGLILYGITQYLLVPTSIAKADAVVAVSGGDTNGRAQRAIDLYLQGYAPLVIFSGAAADPNSPSNARVMEKLAIKKGVPAGAIRIDEFSRDTKENATGVKNILIDSKKIILVTSEYHQRRAHKDLQAALPQAVIYDAPAKDKDWDKFTWWLTPYGWWVTVGEIAKNLV